MTAQTSHEFDLVLWGASGFTGRLVAEQLAQRAAPGLRWALAGRDEAKVAQVRAALGSDFAELPILVADAHDRPSLDTLVARTAAVCSTVGPFARHGSELVAACARLGTHYCDITGEVPWVSRMKAEHDARARASGARIVHFCGFDCLPSELGVEFLQSEMRARHGVDCHRIDFRVRKSRGSFSGGTVASLSAMVEDAAADPELRAILADTRALCPDADLGARVPDRTMARYDRDFAEWAAPFVMGPVNTRVVRWTHALARPDAALHYDEAVLTGSGVAGWAAAVGLSVAMPAFMLAMVIKPTRHALQRFVLPKAGEGPDLEARMAGFFDIELRGRGGTGDGHRLAVRVYGDRDPGYGATSRMLTEAALCLAEQAGERWDCGGGFWPPGYVLGGVLRERLSRHAGLSFTVLD